MPTPSAPEPTPTPPAGSTGVYPAALPAAPPQPPGDPSPSLLHLFGSSLVKLLSADPDDAPTIITAKPPPETTPDVAGKKLGHFELIEAIGAGGMATVLKARDLELGRIVALKILPPATAKDSEAVARFKLEGRAAARLDHDNVARVYFCGEDQGLYFIAFEFVAGENLRQIIDRRGPLPAGECVRYMRQVAAGLQHAADRGVVHRDIKPSNILITPDGKAKIVDMGLARHAESISINGGVTQSGVTLGTFDYISPEQAMDPRRADVRSDIYSLGCAFYHALTGRPPVPEGTAAKKLYAHQHENPPDPRGINPKVPDALAVVLSKMMAKDPDRRYPSPDALGLDLAALARDWDLPDDGLPPPPGVPATLAAGPPRVPLGLVLAGSIAAVAVAIFIGTGGPPAAAPVVPWADIDKGPPKPAPGDIALAPVPQPKPGPAVADGREFAAAVRAGAKLVHLRRGTTYDIANLPDAVAFDGPELVIEVAPVPATGTPPELRVADGHRAGGLIIRGAKSFTLRGVRVVVTDGPDAAGDDDPVGVVVEGADRVTLDAVQVRADRQAVGSRLVGLAVRGGVLDVRHALFDLGTRGVGVRLTGAVTAEFAQAAFAPHDAAIQLRPDPAGGVAAVALRECSFMLDRGAAAVEAEAAAGGRITAGYCVFAAAGPPPPGTNMPGAAAPDARPVVLRLAADATARFTGRPAEPNLYYRTDAAAVNDRGHSFEDLAKLYPAAPPATDPNPRPRDTPPWQAVNPRGRLADPDTADTAFRLMLSDAKTRAPDKVIAVGAKYVKADGVTLYPTDNWPPARPKPTVVAAAGQRVVWPAADPADAAAGVYADFLAAYAALEPGETLLLAHTGPVAVPNLPEKANLRATIAAYPKFFPELVPAGESKLRDASLFRLTDGEITFDGVAILPGTRAAAVAISGGRACTFKNCVITLDEKDENPQAAVTLTDPMREMMKPGPQDSPPAPAVRFENCLIRGKGRAVWVQAGRAFDAAAENTAAVLDGPLLVVEHAAKDAAPAAAGGLRLTRTTLVLGGPVVELHAPKDPAARVLALSVDADRCLFAPLSRRKVRPLVVVADADPVAEPRKYLAWRTAGANAYANYDRTDAYLDLRPADDGPPTASLDADQWRAFTGDAGKAVRVKFAGVGLAVRPTAVRAADVTATESPGMTTIDAGAAVAELPKMAAER